MDYISVEEATTRDGLRLVLTQGVPGPWGESAKAIFHVKGLEYTAVAQLAGMENDTLRIWTGQTSAPVAVYNNEQPRTQSLEILYLAERLQPEPPLIPHDARLRAHMFGLVRELIGENGFGWCRRLMLFQPLMTTPGMEELAQRLGSKYGYTDETVARAAEQSAIVLELLSEQLENQKASGSAYFIGDSLSALDIYWACFSNMLSPMPHELNPMPQGVRAGYECHDERISAAASPLLLEHRDYIFKTYLKLPLEF